MHFFWKWWHAPLALNAALKLWNSCHNFLKYNLKLLACVMTCLLTNSRVWAADYPFACFDNFFLTAGIKHLLYLFGFAMALVSIISLLKTVYMISLSIEIVKTHFCFKLSNKLTVYPKHLFCLWWTIVSMVMYLDDRKLDCLCQLL